MATPQIPAPLSLEQLLDAVDHLSPPQWLEFERRLAERRAEKGDEGRDEGALVRAARLRLPVGEERRLKRLIARSERGNLTEKELIEYQALAQEIQRIDAARAEALAELARRRRKSVRAIKVEIGLERGTEGA
jgi:hypothetical protein